MSVSVNRINDPELDKYDVIDQSLIPSKDFVRNFGDDNDYVEAHVYTKDGRLLQSDYRYRGFSIPSDIKVENTATVNSLIFDPAAHIQSLGYNVGDFKIDYRVYRKKIFNLAEKTFFINEISSDRTEIRLISTLVSDSTLESNTLNFLYEIQTSPYFKDFLLNFGENRLVNAVNIALDKNTTPYSIVIKLYQPLPAEFDLKSSLWIVEELADPIQFEVELLLDPIEEVVEFIGPPNFDLNLDSHQAISSTYQSLSSIYTTDSLTSYQNVINKLNDSSIGINVDYSDFNNFIHFSSAVERLNNFIYKLQLIEGYKNNIDILQSVPNYTSGSVNTNIKTLENTINGIIQKFDGYENYLYTVSESASWPKTGVYPDFTLATTTSPEAVAWIGSTVESDPNYGGMALSASFYDLDNQNNLIFSVPEFISTDKNNEEYLLFLNMVGQHFDNIWIYIKAINDIHKADNSFKEGISKDMVYTALRSLGIKLYNNNTNENIFDYLVGNVSGSYTVTESLDLVSGEDKSKEVFKRLYHNLPYLLKSKGTNRGIKALVSTFGIPDTILSLNEYGGSDKFASTLEYVYERFTYALKNAGTSNFDLRWAPLTQNNFKYGHFNLVPDAIEFVFKPDLNNINPNVTLLQKFADGLNVIDFGITMNYTSSNGVPSANINFLLSDNTEYVSSSLTLPIYKPDESGESYWWNVLLRRNYKYTTFDIHDTYPYDTASIQQYDLIVKNNISGRIGFQASASIYATGSNRGMLNHAWSAYGDASNPYYLTIGSPSLVNGAFLSGSTFNGYLQEVRYWSEPLLDNAFNAHVLNRESYEGNYSGSAFNDLAARFPLGNNLVTYNHSASTTIESVHPNYTVPYSSGSIGSLLDISLYGSAVYGLNLYGATGLPFSLNENRAFFFRYPDQNNYDYFYVNNYANTINSGYYTPVTEKIRIVDNLVDSEVLSPMVKLEVEDTYRTKDTHFADVSFSPQNEINKDIIAQYGSTLNIDNIIGNPATQYDSRYDNLDSLRQEYYAKFASKYNLTDFINLIKSVDNTLFKMLEDYVPARTNLSTGITIKSPILERNRAQRQQPSAEKAPDRFDSLDPLNITGDTSHTNVNGSTEEFITSELSGSIIDLQYAFEKANFNPYILATQSFDEVKFENSDFNVLQGIVSNNITSSLFKKIDPNNDEILVDAEIQDGYYTYKRNSLPRYEGSKSTSAEYNVHTPGDSSYGKNAAIDYNVLKFGWVDRVNSKNLDFYNKTKLNLKHLIDASGSLLDLNTDNKNIFEVQNTFKSGDQVVVSLLDKTYPTNQTTLEGSKEIFVGGFSYSPILYRDLDETLHFSFLNPTQTTYSNLGVKAFSTSSYTYIVGNNATVRNPAQPPANSGDGYYYTTNGDVKDTTGIPMSNLYYTYNTWPYYNSSIAGLSYTNLGPFTGGRPSDGDTFSFDLLKFSSLFGGYNTEPSTYTYQEIDGTYYYVVPRDSTYAITGSINFSFRGIDAGTSLSLFKVVGIVEQSTTPSSDTSWTRVGNTKLTALNTPVMDGVGKVAQYDSISNTILFDATMLSDWNFNLRVETTASLTAGAYIRFNFYLLDIQKGLVASSSGGWNYFKFELKKDSFLEIYDATRKIKQLVTTGSVGQVPSLFTYDPGSVIFSSYATNNFYSQSIFLPEAPYSENYSPVTDIFEIEPGDLFRFGEFTSTTPSYYEVASVEKTPNIKVIFKGDTTLLPGSVDAASFAILRKKPDETSVILNFNKQEGETSKALLIPHNLTKAIADDVANIIQPLRVPLSTQ